MIDSRVNGRWCNIRAFFLMLLKLFQLVTHNSLLNMSLFCPGNIYNGKSIIWKSIVKGPSRQLTIMAISDVWVLVVGNQQYEEVLSKRHCDSSLLWRSLVSVILVAGNRWYEKVLLRIRHDSSFLCQSLMSEIWVARNWQYEELFLRWRRESSLLCQSLALKILLAENQWYNDIKA